MKFNNLNDFPVISNDIEWTPLKIRKHVSQLEREIGFIKDFGKKVLNIGNFGDKYIYLNLNQDILIELNDIKYEDYINTLLRLEPNTEIKILNIGYILSDDLYEIKFYHKFIFGDRYLYIHEKNLKAFYDLYSNYIKNNIFDWNNLINIIIMVKNAGESFKDILSKNIPYMDRYTILDTGSTDNTIEIAKSVLKDIKGEIFQEPFINFRDSRNRLIELASNHCTFNIMLDDTYVLNGELRTFLDYVRGDDYADSYSIYIKNSDITYSSNRIFKSNRNIKYIYTMHEIPSTNLNVQIPEKICYITDIVNDYMTNRTISRKKYDLQCLFNDLIEYNNNPRTYYYIAETYLNLMSNDPSYAIKAYEYYNLRANSKNGYSEEIQDSYYKMAVIGMYNLNYEWNKCLELFLECFNYDNERPESLIIIGKYYYDNEKYNLAFMFLEYAYNIGLPKNRNMNIKTLLYYYHLPKMLLNCCYKFKKYNLGLKICENLNLNFNNDINNLNLSYYNTFNLLNDSNVYYNTISNKFSKIRLNNLFTVIIVANGGWNKWDGKSLYKDGLGGSETWAIKYAEKIAEKLKNINMIVFCNCESQLYYNNVYYIPISEYSKFIVEYTVDVCFVSRYVYYLHLSLEYIKKVYLVNHDLLLDTDIIEDHENLKGIIGISDWHVEYLKNKLPNLINKIDILSYGIDITDFNPINKKKFSFIYSSFANRGLLTLLQIYPLIKQKYPESTLHIFSDPKHFFVQKNCKEEMDNIELLLEKYKNLDITLHGWVNNITLNNYWNSSHIWLYPTNFIETCCHTSYQAAASKTLVVTVPIAGLINSAKNGVLIEGDPSNFEWKNKCLEKLFNILENPYEQESLINKNFDWISKNKNYDTVVSDFINKYIIE